MSTTTKPPGVETKRVSSKPTVPDNKKTKARAPKVKKKGAFYYAMPWNLVREITELEFKFSAKNIIATYLVIIGVMVGISFGFKLWLVSTLVMVGVALWYAPRLIMNSYRNKYEKKRFTDVNVYIEQALYAFKNSQKVLTTLEDVKILFRQGTKIRKTLDEAIEYIVDPRLVAVGESAERKALDHIESVYPNDYVRSLHRFILKVESIGGNFDSSIDMQLENRAMWENRMHKLQDQRKAKRMQIGASVIATLGLCMMMLYVLPDTAPIDGLLPIQITNVVVSIILLRIYVSADKKLSSDLLASQSYADAEKLGRDYHRYVNYDPRKGMINSLIFAIVPAIVLFVGIAFTNTWAIGIGGVLTVLMLFQHKLGHNALGQRMRREIGMAFPQWLMELALLLQSENVQVAIFKSIDNALPVLKPELENLKAKLMEDPAAAEPFLEFFEDFDMPEVTTSMQMLYSLNVGNGGDAEEQITNIVKRNSIILDRAEQLRNDNSVAGMQLMFMAPTAIGGAVLMIDMGFFIMTFLSNMNLGL